ncbi:MAG: C40 family peptidase [Bacteroidales bacterium]|nr:C40 family peptidase [Bacteroidales bacterium]
MQIKRVKILVLGMIAAVCAFSPVDARGMIGVWENAGVAGGREAVLPAPADSVTLSAAQVADLLIEEAYKHIGTPYRYGARGPKAFDCSGFTSYVYRRFGIALSHSSRDQAKDGRAVEGTFADMQKGDIVIFGARASRRSVGHVGIFIEMSPDGQDFTFIHAAVHGGVTVSHITEEYYAVRFLGARRVLPDFDVEIPEEKEETIDFEAVYGNVFLPVKDTLSLGRDDSRIVLFSDGRWALLNEDGSLSGPGEGSVAGSRIILNPGGTWQPLSERSSNVRVPSLAAGGTAQGAASQAAAAQNAAPRAAAASAAGAPAAAAPADAQYHTIKSGDTLDKISKTYGTTIDRLCELNGITRKTILHIGRRLRVK